MKTPAQRLEAAARKLARQKASLAPREILLGYHVTEEELADLTGLELNTVKALVAGRLNNERGRQKISNAVGLTLWDGIHPQPDIAGEDGRIIAEAIWQGAAIWRRPADDPESIAAASQQLAELLTPELKGAMRRQFSRLPLLLMGKVARVFGTQAVDDVFGIGRGKSLDGRDVIRLSNKGTTSWTFQGGNLSDRHFIFILPVTDQLEAARAVEAQAARKALKLLTLGSKESKGAAIVKSSLPIAELTDAEVTGLLRQLRHGESASSKSTADKKGASK